MLNRIVFMTVILAAIALILYGCSKPTSWPESPLYEFPESDPGWNQPPDIEAAMQTLVGHYAHYDVVAYEDVTTQVPMLTFIISYGFTDLYLENGELYQLDTFVHAEQKINQTNIESRFRSEAAQAIKPQPQKVEVFYKDRQWHIYRPPNPTLLGITGDPLLPLSRDPNDPNLTDPDGDGNPGVTVDITIGKIMKGEIYLTRREIYSYYLTLHSNGNLYGHVVDSSEQFVVGASRRILAQESNPYQIPDVGMSPIMLIRISDDIDTPEELMAMRDRLFPAEPEFVEE